MRTRRSTSKSRSMAKIVAICSSEEKGTKKQPVQSGVIQEDHGLVGDAHADCCTHRQVSLLAKESIDGMQDKGFDVGAGDFAENLTTEGIHLTSLSPGCRLLVGKDVVLEVTQIGKKCHGKCAIFHEVGKCVMPKEGVFARVVRGGLVQAGDPVELRGQQDTNG